MGKNISFLMIFILFFLASCGKELDKTNECDKASSSSFEESYECPSGNPKNEDIELKEEISQTIFEAGFSEKKIIEITNKGDAKLFDFNVQSNFNVSYNNCPSRFQSGGTCVIEIEIYGEVAGDYEMNLSFSDRTGKINKKENIKYTIEPSYPVNKILFYNVSELNFDKKRIIVGPLQDRFGNIIEDDFIINSDRILKNNEFDVVSQETLYKTSVSGSYSFYIETDSLNNNSLIDSGQINIFSNKIYKDGFNLNENISITFFNNKPTIDNTPQIFNFQEDSEFNSLSNLIQGEDPQGIPVTHLITKFPKNGVISNCLSDSDFINFITCTYTPNPNFYGTDSFEYKAFNGENQSFDSAVVNINIGNIPDAPILKNQYTISALENTAKNFTLNQPVDLDNQTNFTYTVTSTTSNGNLFCNLNLCTYTPNNGFIGQDSFQYKTKDIDNLESNIATVLINVENKNDKPILGGNQTFSTTEDISVSFQLDQATDPDGDSLTYQIKEFPNKGKLLNCIEDLNLNCTYQPNENVDTADTFSYIAIDSNGEESDPRSVTITINQVNDKPSFLNLYQEEQVVPETPISFILLDANDPDSTNINYEIVDFPSKGIISNCLGLGNNGLSCQYTPPNGVFDDFTSFTYRAQDPNGAYSELRTVKIIISNTNSSPSLVGSIILNLNEDEEKDFQLIRGNDDITAQSDLKYYLGNTSTQNGELKNCLNISDLIDRNNDTINCKYIPNENYTGQDSFSYYVEDGRGNQSSEIIVQINISPINDAPIFNEEIQEITVNEDETTILNLLQAEDPENDSLLYSIETNPENGTLNCDGDILTSCTYLSNLNYNGKDFFIYKAFDGIDFTLKRVDLVISPINDAPDLNDQTINTIVLEDKISQFDIQPANDVDTDNDLITYELVTAPTKGLLSNCLGINGVEGLNCSYLGKSNEVNSDTFKIKAYDGLAYSTTKTITLNITNENDVPYFDNNELGPFRIEAGDQITLELEEALDLEGDFLSYQIIEGPNKGSVFNCFSGGNLECTYVSNKGSEGEDYFIYKAYDLENDSFNNVTVKFIIEKEKNHRIFPVLYKGGFDYAKKNLLSSPSVAYNLNNGTFLNLSSSEGNYSSNQLIYLSKNGNVTNLNKNIFKGKEIFLEDKKELLLFENSVGGGTNKIISVKEDLNFNEISYPSNINVSTLMYLNKNVFAGSTNSKLYKLNLLEINDIKYYYFDHLIKKSNLLINNDNSNVKLLHSYGDKIIFSYVNDNGKTELAEVDSLSGRYKLLTNENGFNYTSISETILYNNEDNIRIYFLANTPEGKRIFYYDYEEQELFTVSMNISLQKNLINPKIYHGENKDFILMYNEFNNKMAALQLDFNILYDLPYEDIKEFKVSNDKSKTIFIQNNGNSYITSKNPNLEMISFTGLDVNKAYSVKNDHFVLSRRNSNEMYFLDSQNVLEKIDVNPTFNLSSEETIISDNKFYFQSSKTVSNGEILSLYEYKYDLNYEVNKGVSNSIYGFPKSQDGQYIELVDLPENGILSNCLSLNNTSINDLECSYLPNNNYVGSDSFRYDIKNSNDDEIIKQINVELNVLNKKPFFDNTRKIVEFANFNNFNLEVFNYTYINDELFFSAYDISNEKYGLYRFNQAEGLRIIKSSESKFENIAKSDSLLFFSENNELYKYLPEQKVISSIYNENSNVAFFIRDVVVMDNYLYMITKGSGNPPINSLIKLNIDNNQTSKVVLPNALEEGKFIKFNNSFYIESRNKISFFNMEDETFILNDSLSDPIQVGRGVQKDQFLIFIVDSQLSGIDVTSLVIYDPSTQTEISKTPLFALGYKTGDIAVPRLNENGSYSFLVETIALDDSLSTNELIRKDIQSRDERVLSFSGIYEFDTLIREVNEDLFFVSRNENWEKAIFYTYSNKENYFVLNGSTTSIKLKEGLDSDNESVSYLLTETPSYGTITNCLGINSDNNDLECDYIHTDTSLNSVIDYFSYKAFDGYEYSEERRIKVNIRNNPPEFEEYIQNIDINKNISENVEFLEAIDPENNQIYYIVEDLPSKGTLTNCSLSVNDLNNSKYCTYTPNNNVTGSDSYSYRAYDGLSYSDKVIVDLNINDNNSPIFNTNNQKEYVSKSTINYIIILEKAIDPQGQNLTYQITRPPQFGSISNCFNLVDNRLQCTYTPNDPSLRALDSFKYQASNGNFNSEEREVLISITASNMTGSLGDLYLNEDNGLLLLKNGVDNTDALRNLEGFDFDEILKIVTLPANRDYNFRTVSIESEYTIQFEPFDNVGNKTNDHGFTRIYAQGSCLIDGTIKARGALTNGSSQTIQHTSIDDELLQYTIGNYILGVYGGKGGGSSETQRSSGIYGNPSLFKSGNGQPGVGDVGSEIDGGDRGQDGIGLYLKCLDSIEGIGSIDVRGLDGEYGKDGRDGNKNDVTEVSFGGSGGSGGGNGGFGGSLYLKSSSILFSGDFLIEGGIGGLGGEAGQANTVYNTPFDATDGTHGQDGFNGNSGICNQTDLIINDFSSCF